MELESPTTFGRELAQKEERLAKILDIPSIPIEPIAIPTDITVPPPKPQFFYPMNYTNGRDHGHTDTNGSLSLHKIHLINDEEENDDDVGDGEESDDNNESIEPNKTLKNGDNGSVAELPKVQKMPKFMKIPNLWDIKIERCESTDDEDGSAPGPHTGSDCSEWEFL